MRVGQHIGIGFVLIFAIGGSAVYHGRAIAQKADGQAPAAWVAEIEKVFIRSEEDRKSTRLNSSHLKLSRMPSSA